MIISYLRHLESDANTRKGFCYEDDEQRNRLKLPSDNDVPLTQAGIEHGKRIQPILAKLKLFDPDETDVVESPYVRTVQTREVLLPQYHDSVTSDTRLCERNNGWCANMTLAEVRHYFPWLQNYWDVTNPLLATPPGGECMLDVVHRVLPVVVESIASGRNKLFVGHGNLFKAIDFILQKMLVSDFSKIPNAPNGSLTVYRNVHLGHQAMSIDRYHEVLSK